MSAWLEWLLIGAICATLGVAACWAQAPARECHVRATLVDGSHVMVAYPASRDGACYAIRHLD